MSGETDTPLARAARAVLHSFHEGIWIRNTDGDGEPGWAVKLAPHVLALSDLARLSGYAEAVGVEQASPKVETAS